MEFVNDLELWFKTERKCGQNATMKYISILKMIVLFCVNNDWLLKDPFGRIKRRIAKKKKTNDLSISNCIFNPHKALTLLPAPRWVNMPGRMGQHHRDRHITCFCLLFY